MPIEKLIPKFIFDEERIKQLKQIAPEAFADGKINWETLRESLGGQLEEEGQDAEHFGLFWPGKRDARKIAALPSTGALAPVNGEGIEEDKTCNIFIEGENLEVLKLLQKSYADKIKLIYIDPPYNTGNDFVYEDDFKEPLDEYLRRTGQLDEEGKPFSTNSKTDGRFHSKWLSMMYPRLRLARNLLRNDGVIFISIDNNEIHNLKAICNEIFGEENFVECITWNKRIPKNDKGIGSIHEYILIYVKDSLIRHEFIMRKEGLEEIDELVQKLKRSKTSLADAEAELKKFYNKKGYDRGITLYNSFDENFKLWGKINMSWPNSDTFGPKYVVLHPKTNKPVKVPDRGWRWKEDTFNEAAQIKNGKYQNVKKLHNGTFMCGRIWFDKDEKIQPSSINYLEEVDTFLLRSIISLKSDGGIELEDLFEGKSYFSYPKPSELLKILFKSIENKKGDIYLDFFAGSGTTAQAIIDINLEDNGGREFILIQLPEPVDEKSEAYKMKLRHISDITKERIRKVISIQKRTNAESEIDLGFKVFKLTNSNYKSWNNYDGQSKEELEKQFSLFITPLVDGWKQENLLSEILLLEGFPLNSKIELQKDFKKNKLSQIVSDFCEHKLLICLDKKIAPETVASLKLNDGDIFICLDSAISDQDKVRLSDKGLIKTI